MTSLEDHDDDDRLREDTLTIRVLERRAELLRRPLVAIEDRAGTLVGAFALGDELFAFPIAAMRATIPLRLVTPVPLAPAHVLGVVRYDRAIVPVLSLPALLGDRAWRRDPAVLIVLEIDGGALVAVDCAEIPVPAPLRDDVERSDAGALATIADLQDGRRVKLIDLKRLGERARRHGA